MLGVQEGTMEVNSERLNSGVADQRKVRHDFTGMRWGWGILKVWPQDDGLFDMMGVGRGLKDGDRLVLRADQGMDVEMIINCVHYYTNPPDLFKLVARSSNNTHEQDT